MVATFKVDRIWQDERGVIGMEITHGGPAFEVEVEVEQSGPKATSDDGTERAMHKIKIRTTAGHKLIVEMPLKFPIRIGERWTIVDGPTP